MKRLVYLCFFLLTRSTFAETNSVSVQPTLDLGTLNAGEMVPFKLLVKNHRPTPTAVESVRADCSCVSKTPASVPISGKSEYELPFEVSTGQRAGRREVNIVILCANDELLTTKVAFSVKAKQILAPAKIQLQRFGQGDYVFRSYLTLDQTPEDPETVRLESKNHPDLWQFKVRRIAQDEAAADGEKTQTYVWTLEGKLPGSSTITEDVISVRKGGDSLGEISVQTVR